MYQPGEQEDQQVDHQNAHGDPQHDDGPRRVDRRASEGQGQHDGLGQQKLQDLAQDPRAGRQLPPGVR